MQKRLDEIDKMGIKIMCNEIKKTYTKWNIIRWRTLGRGRRLQILDKNSDQRNECENNISLEKIWVLQNFLE